MTAFNYIATIFTQKYGLSVLVKQFKAKTHNKEYRNLKI